MFFPTWRYHASKPAVIVHTTEAEAALGSGWFDCPTKAAQDAEAAAKAEADKPPVTLDGISVAKAERFLAAANLAQIAVWYDAEIAGDGRKSMLAALEARAAELS
jgi:hypothetical protein